MSDFSICHRYSLLCYLTSCSVVCHLFCFCKIYAVFLFVTQCDYDVPALSSRYAAKLCISKHFSLLSSATKRSIHLYIPAYFYLAQHATQPLFYCQKKDTYLNRLRKKLHFSAALILHSIRWDVCP